MRWYSRVFSSMFGFRTRIIWLVYICNFSSRVTPEKTDLVGQLLDLVESTTKIALDLRRMDIQVKVKFTGRIPDRQAFDLKEVDTAANERPQSTVERSRLVL